MPSLLHVPSLFFYHLQAKMGPAAAFLWAFCPCSGRRLALRGSCYNFHFLNIFLSFFFFSAWKPRRVFYPPALRPGDEGRGERWQLRFGLLSLQRRQTNKVQTAHSCRVLAEGSCGVVLAQRGVDHVCEVGGLVT